MSLWINIGRSALLISLIALLASCNQLGIEQMKYKPALKYYYSETEYLNYESVGQGNTPLIFLHGFGASLRNWDDTLPYLATDDFTCYLFDLKGSGFSSKPKVSDYSIKEQAKLISAFIETNDIKDYGLIGHSFGGGISLIVALNFLENPKYRPKYLILIDTASYIDKLPFFIKNLRLPLINHLILNFTSPHFKSKYTLERVVHNREIITPELIDRYACFSKLDGYNNALINTANQIIPKDIESYTSKYSLITISTLIIWGKNDPVLPLSSGRRLLEELPNAHLNIINNCGHNPQEEYPGVVADHILSFLKQHKSIK